MPRETLAAVVAGAGAVACRTTIVLAVFKLIPVTLTLSGVAGFILSVDAAVDALNGGSQARQRVAMTQASTTPVAFDVQHPEKLSRLMLLLKSFLGWLYVGIPHGIILYVYGILTNLVTLIAFFAILITGKYPLGLFNFVVGYYRWGARVAAYLSLMTDKYPPFPRPLPCGRLQIRLPWRCSTRSGFPDGGCCSNCFWAGCTLAFPTGSCCFSMALQFWASFSLRGGPSFLPVGFP